MKEESMNTITPGPEPRQKKTCPQVENRPENRNRTYGEKDAVSQRDRFDLMSIGRGNTRKELSSGLDGFFSFELKDILEKLGKLRGVLARVVNHFVCAPVLRFLRAL